jgi:hypothetical protein
MKNARHHIKRLRAYPGAYSVRKNGGGSHSTGILKKQKALISGFPGSRLDAEEET